MSFGVMIVVLLAVNALAAVVACYRLGAFRGSIDALRIDHRDEMEAFRRRTDHVVNHVMSLGEKVDRSHASTTEMSRLLNGARAERDSQGGKRGKLHSGGDF